jgi:hypothetical protein
MRQIAIRLCAAKSCLPTVSRYFPGSRRSRGNDWYVTGAARPLTKVRGYRYIYRK